MDIITSSPSQINTGLLPIDDTSNNEPLLLATQTLEFTIQKALTDFKVTVLNPPNTTQNISPPPDPTEDLQQQAQKLTDQLNTIQANNDTTTITRIAQYLAAGCQFTGLLGNVTNTGFQAYRLTALYWILHNYHKKKVPKGWLHPHFKHPHLIIAGTTRTSRQKAITLQTQATRAYGIMIQNHLYWKLSCFMFLFSLVGLMGIIIIFISYIVDEIKPGLELARYGYGCTVVSASAFTLGTTSKTIHQKYLAWQASRKKSNYQEALFLINNQSSISNNQDMITIDNESSLKNDLEKSRLQYITLDCLFGLHQLLTDLIQEQSNNRHKEGPIFNFLKGTLGIKTYLIHQLIKNYSKKPHITIQQLNNLIFEQRLIQE